MIESAAARPMLFPVSTSQSAGIAMAQPAMADAMRTSRVGRRLEFMNPTPRSFERPSTRVHTKEWKFVVRARFADHNPKPIDRHFR